MTWTGYSEKGTGSQERGPGSYTADPGGTPAARSSDQGGGVRMARPGMTPTPSINVGQVPSGRTDPTLGAILKLGQEVLQKDIDRRREEAFVQGMVQAASGQALTEIVEQQPAYSRIFGPSAVVEGARAYSAKAAVSRWVAEQQSRMPEIRAMSPDAIPGMLVQTMDGFMTGDPQTDTLIRAEFTNQLPALIRDHTKHHYVYMQEQAKAARKGALQATFDVVQGLYANSLGDRSTDELERAEDSLLEILTPPPGVDLGSHYKDVGDALVTQAQAGHFHPLRVLDELGILNQLPQDVQNRVNQAMRSAAPAQLSRVSAQMVPELVDFSRAVESGQFDSDAAVAAELERLNDKAAGLSGVPRRFGELFGPDRYPVSILRNEAGRERADRAQQRAVSAASREGILTNPEGTGLFDQWETRGFSLAADAENARSVLGISSEEINKAANTTLLRLDPAARGRFLSAWQAEPLSSGKRILSATWAEATGPNSDWEKSGASWTSLYTTYTNMDPVTQGRYFTAEQQRMLEAFRGAVQAGAKPEYAYTARVQLAAQVRERIGEKPKNEDEKAVREVIDDQFTSWWRGDLMPEMERSDLEALVLAQVGVNQSTNPNANARAAQALGTLQGSGRIALYGGRLTINLNAQQALDFPLTELPGLTGSNETIYRTLHELADERARAVGGDPKTRRVVRLPSMDQSRVVFQVITYNDEGEQYNIITSDDLRERISSRPRGGGNRGGLRGPTAARPYVAGGE